MKQKREDRQWRQPEGLSSFRWLSSVFFVPTDKDGEEKLQEAAVS
jgi:hypothetical protein